MMEDVKRLIRHLIPVAAVYAVNRGWIPENMQTHVIEIGVILSGIIVSLVWSYMRDQTK